MSILADRAQEVVAEHPDPVGGAIGALVQRRRTVEQVHEGDLEAGPFQSRTVFWDAREVPGNVHLLRGHALLGDGLAERVEQRLDVALAAHLGDKSAARPERAGDTGEHRILGWYPVKHGAGEDAVNRCVEAEVLAPSDLEAEIRVRLAGPSDHRLGRVDPDRLGAGLRDLGGQVAGSAAEIQDALAGLGRQQVHHA
jgi:hypothetical protein